MPPRKSNVSTFSATADEPSMVASDAGADTPSKAGENSGPGRGRKKASDVGSAPMELTSLGIDDYMMPRMMTVRLAKGVLPPQTLIHKDAATAMQYATSVFLNHIANAANEHTLAASRKNISPQDIMAGIKDAEWGFLVPQLEEELAIYVRQVNDKRNEYRRKLKERGSGVGVGDGTGADGANGEEDGADAMDGDLARDSRPTVDDGPRPKRVRLSESATMMEASQLEEDLEDDEQDGEDEEGEDDEEEGAKEGHENEETQDADELDRLSDRDSPLDDQESGSESE